MIQNNLSLFVGFCSDRIPVNRFHNFVRFPTAALHDVLIRNSDCVHNAGCVMAQIMKTEVWYQFYYSVILVVIHACCLEPVRSKLQNKRLLQYLGEINTGRHGSFIQPKWNRECFFDRFRKMFASIFFNINRDKIYKSLFIDIICVKFLCHISWLYAIERRWLRDSFAVNFAAVKIASETINRHSKGFFKRTAASCSPIKV